VVGGARPGLGIGKTRLDTGGIIYTEFDKILPTRARYVRLTATDWPRVGPPLGVVEFTVSGKPIEAPMQ
jgi:hypothetical protein